MSRKVTVRARAIKDANVNFISIVDKGATRLPIRALKQEENKMINLDISKLFTRKKQEPKLNPVGLLVPVANVDSFLTALKAEGYENVNVVECESDELRFLSFKEEGDVNFEEAAMLETSTHAVVLENGRKMLKDWGLDTSMSFAENVAANGFYRGVNTAFDTAMSGIWDAMENAEPNTRPTEAVDEILKGLSDYVRTLVENIPQTAFKMERLKPELGQTPTTSENVPSAAVKSETGEPSGDVSTQVVEPTDVALKTEPVVEPTTTTEPTNEPAGESGDETAPVSTGSKDETDPLQLIATQLNTLTELFTNFKTEVGEVSTTIGAQGETLNTLIDRVAKAEKTSKDALTAVNGTTTESADFLDDESTEYPTTSVRKSDKSRASNIEMY